MGGEFESLHSIIMINFLKALKSNTELIITVFNHENNRVVGFDPLESHTPSAHTFDYKGYKITISNTISTNEYCYKTILNTISEGVMLASSKGTITLYNDQMRSIEGLNNSPTVGKQISQVYNVDDAHSEHHIVKNTGVPIVDRYQNYQSTNDKQITSVASTYPILRDGEIIATYSIARNVDKILELLNRTKKFEAGPFVDLSTSVENNTRYTFDNIITKSDRVLKTIERAKNYSKFGGNIMIYGETGVGKELFAQGIHNHNQLNSNQPFIGINCSAIPETLLESMLFGTVKGAYTGAIDKKGLIDEASFGTLFLDEINSMPKPLQGKLLRVLQENIYRQVGGTTPKSMHCRIISATNVEPLECVKVGTLRSDLFYRLSVHTLEILPLSQRKTDILPLVNHFIQKYGAKYGLHSLALNEASIAALTGYNYLGNVRELENIVESAITQVDDSQIITLATLPERLLSNIAPVSQKKASLKNHLLDAERNMIVETLESHNWNVSKSALALDISRQNLQYRLKKLQIRKLNSHSNW